MCDNIMQSVCDNHTPLLAKEIMCVCPRLIRPSMSAPQGLERDGGAVAVSFQALGSGRVLLA